MRLVRSGRLYYANFPIYLPRKTAFEILTGGESTNTQADAKKFCTPYKRIIKNWCIQRKNCVEFVLKDPTKF